MKLKICNLKFNSILNCFKYSGASNQEEISLEDIMIFYSGTDKMPPLGFLHKLTLEFNNDNIYPTASTCTLTLVLPTKYYMDYDSFKNSMYVGLKYHGGFGTI